MTTIIETERPDGQLLSGEALPLNESEQREWDMFVEEFSGINTDLEAIRRQGQGREAAMVALRQEVVESPVHEPRSVAETALELKQQKSDMIDELIGKTPGQALSGEIRYLAGLYEGRTDTWRLADGTEISWFGTRADHNLTIQEQYFVVTAPDGSRRFGLAESRPNDTVYYDIRDDGSMTLVRKPRQGADAGRALVADSRSVYGRQQQHKNAHQTIDNTLSTAGEVRKRSEEARAAADAAAKELYGDVRGFRQLKAAQSMADIESYITEQTKSDNDAPGLMISHADENHFADVAIANRL